MSESWWVKRQISDRRLALQLSRGRVTYLPASTSLLGCRKSRIRAPTSPRSWAKVPNRCQFLPRWSVGASQKEKSTKSQQGVFAMLRTWALAIFWRLHREAQDYNDSPSTGIWKFCALLIRQLPVVSIDICFWLYTSSLSGRTLGRLVEPISFLLPLYGIILVHLLCVISKKGLNALGGKWVTKAHFLLWGSFL